MDKNELIFLHEKMKGSISKRLSDFKKLDEKEYFNEMIFCLLTPQSNAKKCWEAVKQISKLDEWQKEKIVEILRKHTRFHNNKAIYVMLAKEKWEEIKPMLSEGDRLKLRNYISDNVKGYGLKEAGHFLRNIGKSDNKIAILDRHILRNLKVLEVIQDEKIKNKAHYLEIEQKFLNFSSEIGIPIDELDLLFWSKENGEIFK